MPTLIGAVAEDSVLFEADFPHATCYDPKPLKTGGDKMSEFRPEVQRKILGENAAKLYRLLPPGVARHLGCVGTQMRILLVSDLHYSLPQLDWVVAASASYDVVAVAGDSLNINSPVPLDAQSVVVHRYLALIAAQTRLVVSSGNHDLTGPDDGGEQSALWLHDVPHGEILTDGDALVLEDTRITVCPWWDGPLGRAEVVSQLVADAARRPDTWVWLYHWPPLGSPTCWTGRRDYGDPDLRGWIEEFRARDRAGRTRARGTLQE